MITGICKICEKPTPIIFGIKLKQVSICQNCATSIAEQEIAEMFKSCKEE